MATRTPSRSTSTRTRTKTTPTRNSDGEFTGSKTRASARRGGNEDRSAFSFGGTGSGAILGAALAGAAIGLAANYGRKFLMQGIEAQAGDWDEILMAEHEAALAIFDKMLATDASQTFKRKMLLMKLTHALDKHAHQEEMVVYPALRAANEAHDADLLEGEHGYVKTYIYELTKIGPEAPNWLEKVREFRALISKHAHMEEEQVFPRFKQSLTAEQNDEITAQVNRDGFWMA